MKKQTLIVTLALVLAQSVFGVTRSGREMMDFENRVKAIETTLKTATERKQLDTDARLLQLTKMVNGDHAKLTKALNKQPKLVRTMAYLEETLSNTSASALDKRVAAAGSKVMSVYGTAKNLTREGMADAQAESLAVQRFAELIPYLAEFGENAVRVLEVMADALINGDADGKTYSANKALRKAATEVLGLKGQALEEFMKDAAKGLGTCKIPGEA